MMTLHADGMWKHVSKVSGVPSKVVTCMQYGVWSAGEPVAQETLVYDGHVLAWEAHLYSPYRSLFEESMLIRGSMMYIG